MVAPALAARATVLPVAATGHELCRRWRVRIGPPVTHPEPATPDAATALAESAREAVRTLSATHPA
jgi:hypothetical protein